MIWLAASVVWIGALLNGCGGGRHATVATDPPRGPGAAIRFEEVAASAGIHYQWPRQTYPLSILQAFGCGCAFLDYDGDGWQDILLVAEPHPLLYRNLRNGTFADVTRQTGLDRVRGAWKGCAVGDYDGDGFLDVLLTGYHCLALLHNQHGAGWADETRKCGLSPDNGGHWGSGAGFMDLDGDGDLDLVLLNYLKFGPNDKQYCDFPGGVLSACPPRLYAPEFPELWENLGSGRYRRAGAAAGLKDATGTAQVLTFCDVDDDGRMDIFIGNDGTPTDLMRNTGRLHFTNVGVSSGIAYGSEGNSIAAMGADWADYDRDGRLDLVITAFAQEPYSLLHNAGPALFEHAGPSTGLAAATRASLGFGANFLDMDNDGWPDLAFANGHVQSEAEHLNPPSSFRQPPMLFQNQRGKAWRDVAPGQAPEVRAPFLGRGSAAGDFDNDGRMDWLAVDYEGTPRLLHNLTVSTNHWITLDLRAKGKNRFAYGAKVVARAGKETWVGQVSPACSYLSSSDPRIHWGLGSVAKLDSLVVRWPDGTKETLRDVTVDRIMPLQEGAMSAQGQATTP